MPTPTASAIVPTLGRSPWLGECLRALRRSGDGLDSGLEIIVVDQTDHGIDPALLEAAAVDRVIRPASRPLGFAAANNLAITEAQKTFIALVNDDAIVSDDWLPQLVDRLVGDPELAAVQGTTIAMDDPSRIDGRGIAWNHWFQAIQIDHDLPLEPAGRSATQTQTSAVEIFGASATAAIFRRAAFDAIAGLDGYGDPFDERLVSYYEDVDLAIRLRSAGWRACLMPHAVARHAGSATGSTLPFGAREWIHGNRILVVARMLGWRFAFHAPRILLRDLLDLWQARRRGDAETAHGIGRGVRRGMKLLPQFIRVGSPLVPDTVLRRFTDATPR